MSQALAVLLAVAGLTARAAVGYSAIECGDVPPCGCEPIVVCDPCAAAAPPKAPDELPAPADGQRPAASEAAPETTNEFPSPPNVNTPAVTPPSSPVTPTAEETAPVEEPITPLTPSAEEASTTEEPASPEAAPTEQPSRYGAPPAEESTAPTTDPYQGLFPADDAQPDAPAGETPAEEPPAAEESPATEPSPATPGYDELFPPSSDTGILTAPGGWASDSPRPWTDADGRVLVTGRVVGVTLRQVVLSSDDGAEHAFPYAALSDADLRFLREQVAARRAKLTAPGDRDQLLVGQQ